MHTKNLMLFAIVANGMVLVNSGYTRTGGIAGNVLLAFAPED